METRVTLKPGSKGTKKLVTQFGERLVCVRYRFPAHYVAKPSFAGRAP